MARIERRTAVQQMFNKNVKYMPGQSIFMPPQPDFTAVPKRIGGSLAMFIPARVARRRKIREGDPVKVSVEPALAVPALGALKRRKRHKAFDRHEEGFWPED
jgi:antitoxin component of MazEF toxin-antitoxin module